MNPDFGCPIRIQMATEHIKNICIQDENKTDTCANSEQNLKASLRSPQILKGNQISDFWKIS